MSCIQGGTYTYYTAVVGFRNTSLCFPWAGNIALQYPLPTSRLLQDLSLTHRQAMLNPEAPWHMAARVLWAWYIHGGTLLFLFLIFSVLVANPKKLFYTVVNPARGLLNMKNNTKKSGSTPPPTRRIYVPRHYAGLGPSRVRTRIPSTRRLG